MKKIVLTFGLISGAIAALMMLVTIPFIGRVPFEYLTALGYTIFVTCFLMVFFGIRSVPRECRRDLPGFFGPVVTGE